MTPVVIAAADGMTIRLQPAPVARRCAAAALDLLIIGGLTAVAGVALSPAPEALKRLLVPTIGFLILWGYPVWCEVRLGGQTLGKRLTGLRTVAIDGLPLTLPQAVLRSILRILDLAPLAGLVGLTAVLLDPHGRRLGDLIAGTLVVQERLPTPLPAALLTARRHNSLDTLNLRRRVQARIGLEERELLVAFVLRAEALEDEARLRLGEDLGERLRQRLELPADLDHLRGENLVRAVLPLCFPARRSVSA